MEIQKISIVRDNFSRKKRKYTKNRNDLCNDFEQDMIWDKLYFIKQYLNWILLFFKRRRVYGMKDKYYELKMKYEKYVVIMKSGIFYNVLGNDCYLMKSIFGYKINPFGDTIKIGFPLNTLNKVLRILDQLKINYIIYEHEIDIKRRFQHNQYDLYLKNKLTTDERIDSIYFKLRELKDSADFITILERIEEII